MHVYVITNTVNGKIYVGQHAGEDLQAYLQHNIKAALGNRGNKLFLYRAIRKYGPDVWEIKSLVHPVDAEQMTALEVFFIRVLESQNAEIGYNITAGGPGQLGRKGIWKHTEEWKRRMSILRKGVPKTSEWAKKIGDAQRGRPFTEEHKAALRGPYGKQKNPRSAEHCRKIGENKRKWWALRKEQARQNGAASERGKSKSDVE